MRAYISLGSNMGDGPVHLAQARAAATALPGVGVAAMSSVYRTEPQGRKDQPWFANQVLALDCDGMTADALLGALLRIETELGRVRDPADRFGPRVIDLRSAAVRRRGADRPLSDAAPSPYDRKGVRSGPLVRNRARSYFTFGPKCERLGACAAPLRGRRPHFSVNVKGASL